jgi:hypothetical protein
MKVIKQGRVAGWAKELNCTGAGAGRRGSGCGAQLLVEYGDLYTTEHQASYYSVTFTCPECRVMTDIKDYDGPPVHKKGP